MSTNNNGEYWARRMKMLSDALLDRSYDKITALKGEYDRAISDISRDIEAWYGRLAGNNGVTLADARKLLTADELKEFRWTVEEYIKHGTENALDGAWVKELENASAKVHIRRLEALQLNLREQAEELYAKTRSVLTNSMEQTYAESFYNTAFEIQRGIGTGWEVGALDKSLIEKVISKPWSVDGNTFSERVWKNKTDLINSVSTKLTQMIMRGSAPDKTIKAIANEFGVSKIKAGRLVMTESAAMSAAARKDCFESLDVERYQIVSALDRHTCELCGALDGTVHKMSEYAVGITAPPFHPWCRCCTAPYFEDMADLGERSARGADGKTYEVPKNMTYEQWKQKQDEIYGKGFIDTQRKMAYNKKADKEQFDRYSSALTESTPKTLEEFQKVKYGDSDGWDSLKKKYRIVNQYKVDSGTVSESEILALDKKLITEKRTTFPSKYKASGNFAGAYLDGDSQNYYFAHSQIDKVTDKGYINYRGSSELVTLSENRRFKYIDVPKSDGGMRQYTYLDTEAKLFERFASDYDKSAFTSVTMISERGMCDSCKGVMSQFKALFPDVEVNVISNKKVTGNVWGHR